jgi:hypothetical protein
MQATTRRAPRLRMGHLLIWIVGCAVGFAAYRSISPARLPMLRGRIVVSSYSLAMGTAFGTILAGCGLMAYRRWQGDGSYPSRAGHWLLLFGLAAAAADVAAVVAYQRRAAQDPSMAVAPFLAQFTPGPGGFWPVLLHHAVGWTVGALVALGFLLGLRGRLGRHWIAVFVVFSVASALLATAHIISAFLLHFWVDNRRLNSFLVHAYAGAVLAGAVAIFGAVIRDVRSGATADSLHRVGVGTWLAIAAIQMVIYIVYLGWV